MKVAGPRDPAVDTHSGRCSKTIATRLLYINAIYMNIYTIDLYTYYVVLVPTIWKIYFFNFSCVPYITPEDPNSAHTCWGGVPPVPMTFLTCDFLGFNYAEETTDCPTAPICKGVRSSLSSVISQQTEFYRLPRIFRTLFYNFKKTIYISFFFHRN